MEWNILSYSSESTAQTIPIIYTGHLSPDTRCLDFVHFYSSHLLPYNTFVINNYQVYSIFSMTPMMTLLLCATDSCSSSSAWLVMTETMRYIGLHNTFTVQKAALQARMEFCGHMHLYIQCIILKKCTTNNYYYFLRRWNLMYNKMTHKISQQRYWTLLSWSYILQWVWGKTVSVELHTRMLGGRLANL